jgi:N utilization substance protein B
MLSRRVVRIKVMQLLYAISRDPQLTTQDIISMYQKGVEKNFEFYLLNLAYFLNIVDYAYKDAELRAKKLIRSTEDHVFKPKLAENSLVKSLRSNCWLDESIKKHHLSDRIIEDTVKKLYNEFSKTEEYHQYILNEQTNEDDTREILLALYRFVQGAESFNEEMEDFYYSWDDDKTLVVGAMKKTIKGLPAADDFYQEHLHDSEVVFDFGEQLLKKTALREKELLEIIEPNLKNWDADRVAIIDMVLIKMGMIEFTDFPTIPTKVTLNEYVELSKVYSTDKSKDFVNGILDRILKKMQKEDLVQKEGRGLMD